MLFSHAFEQRIRKRTWQTRKFSWKIRIIRVVEIKYVESNSNKLGRFEESRGLFESKSHWLLEIRGRIVSVSIGVSHSNFIAQTIDKRGFFKQVRSCCSFSANTHVALDKQWIFVKIVHFDSTVNCGFGIQWELERSKQVNLLEQLGSVELLNAKVQHEFVFSEQIAHRERELSEIVCRLGRWLISINEPREETNRQFAKRNFLQHGHKFAVQQATNSSVQMFVQSGRCVQSKRSLVVALGRMLPHVPSAFTCTKQLGINEQLWLIKFRRKWATNKQVKWLSPTNSVQFDHKLQRENIQVERKGEMCEQIVRSIVSSQDSNRFYAFERAQHDAQLQQLFVSERFDQSQVRRELPENAYIGLCIHVFEERFEFVAIQSANIHNEQK